MAEDNHLGRLLALLVLTFIICCSFYYFPDYIAGLKLKRVDLFSDLRSHQPEYIVDSLDLSAQYDSTFSIDSAALQRMAEEKANMDSAALALRDSLYKALYAVEGADSLGIRIEDYSVGHIGLKKFFTALRNSESDGRVVRIGVLGDSFIEGDIFVADLRAELQRAFGGKGVGFVPISSVAAQYRPTIRVESEGWKTWSLLNDSTQRYVMSCMLFEVEENDATIDIKKGTKYPELQSGRSLKLIYCTDKPAKLVFLCNDMTDSIAVSLQPSDTITQYVYDNGNVMENVAIHLSEAKGFKALGFAIEEDKGVVVDNFSVRGNSGLILEHLDKESCNRLNNIRPYDLLIMQYGLNVANDSVMQYGWYGKRMETVVNHVRNCFPSADILILGVSDRSMQDNGKFKTMPSVISLLYSQRRMAKRAGLPFWNTFGAMGGENSMVEYVDKNWASKDYTHLGFGGGRELARILFEALMKEKDFYDEAEKE